MPKLLMQVPSVLAALLVQAHIASAQPTGNGRGIEGGLDVLSAASSGEVAFYIGGFQGNQMVAFRFGARDERDAVPCSAGVMYEYVGRRGSPRLISPVAGVAISRIFSCATDEEALVRPSPLHHGSVAASGGIRLGIFRGGTVDGSLKLLGYVEQLRAHQSSGNVTNGGVMVGVALHGR